MSNTLNRAQIVGYIGKAPEVRAFQNGGKTAKFSVATDESYTDKNGERHNKAEWHQIVVYGKLVDTIEKLQGMGDLKGTQVLLEGKLQTRKWEKAPTEADAAATAPETQEAMPF